MENRNLTALAHTLAPWHSAKGEDGDIVVLGSDSDWYICSLNPDDPKRAENARLIVAAPKLLEACTAVVNAWESGDLAAAARLCASAAREAESR